MRTQEQLLEVVLKCGRFVNRGIVSGREFINKVFDEFAHIEQDFPDVFPELWAAVPEGIQGDFAEAIRDAARPDFRYHAFYLGGGRPMTEDEIRRDADLRTGRVQAWAREFTRFLAGVKG